MPAFTIDELAKAIAHKMGAPIEVARDKAYYFMNFFGYGDEVIDNIFEPEERIMLRDFEQLDLIDRREDEVTLSCKPGNPWTIHYVFWNTENIKVAAALYGKAGPAKEPVEGPADEQAEIYNNPKIWQDVAELRSQTSSMPGLPGSAAPALEANPDI